MPDPFVSQAREALIAAGITGPHKSHKRASNIAKIHALIEGESEAFGLSGISRYSAGEILTFMAEITGCSDDIADLQSDDWIDPDLTMAGIAAAAEDLAEAASRGDSLLIATGHPTGMLEHNIRVADAYQRAGGKIVRPREEEKLPIGSRGRDRQIRYIGGVGCEADWGALLHTHSAVPMEALLEATPWPDIVFGDHGFAGAAIERDIPTIAVMDINDHALAVAGAEARSVTIIPMDDNRTPFLYEPSWRIFERTLLGGSQA